jgi:hypothetical protein
MSKNFVLTPEQLALREERKRQKLESSNDAGQPKPKELYKKGSIIPREWRVAKSGELNGKNLKILTWNVRAGILAFETH